MSKSGRKKSHRSGAGKRRKSKHVADGHKKKRSRRSRRRSRRHAS